MDDIARQARQGSVSAIIQILNEKLASSGVRTRAVLAQGVLQLLCEAAKPEQLEQSILVPQVQQILESIQPKHIRRVNINSRIVREQQLLWLEEISRDRNKQVLWAEEITLKKPNFFQRVARDWQDNQPDPSKPTLPKASVSRLSREKQQFWRGLLGGAVLSLGVLVIGWLLYERLVLDRAVSASSPASSAQTSSASPAAAGSTSISTSSPSAPASPSVANSASSDPFAEAVRLAEQTAASSRTTQTSAEWLEVASRWQKASDLMAQVASTDSRYATAQNRVEQYRQNSQIALDKAAQTQ
ncbi:hypothetical protein [Leptolyngbya sp. FACHB-711]|uniref:hypothetical protein n=1 Tax=unclassified Leptolyngbya TaxID=2650499 RepID=UPI001684F81D|nr:hypothetical protein [Leptolyngbya sp. FACHB-711]MBD1851865.1 hypothetical protein [Cyanobacteria bacterium FACHB-502]MBD2027861.1 hypothetical protein [Leptolyngbya sp. FACHB-711]